jgi:uncharacterized protein
MHTNALIHEKSPYLRQHAHNPVNWLPWGETAFQKARDEDKPIFLSVGYSTCHWCHVMAHESFENDRVAEMLNQHFVSIKLDREERPDIDRVYMLFVQASTGSGGWPMTVFLTPDLKPFFGGTYFPPDSRYGRPGFLELLKHLINAWKDERERILSSSNSVIDQLKAYAGTSHVKGELDRELFTSGFAPFRRSFDSHWGGFGAAPKFPRPSVLNYLLRLHALDANEEALEMTAVTLQHMALGGMHDQLGGGFHRYSVDERWFVPHFEKMLYDQAQLAVSYLEAFQITGEQAYASVARGIFRYVLRDLTDAGGAFYSAEDADSARPENPDEHGEGAFYVWTADEIARLLEPEAARVFELRFGMGPNGNVDQDPHAEFTGKNILYQARTLEEVAAQTGLSVERVSETLARAGAILFTEREKRPRPHLDNKVLAAWNGLMISAFVKGFVVLGEQPLLHAAERAAQFLFSSMSREGALLRRYCEGEAAIDGFLDDYAFVAQAALDLFEATGQEEYLTRAVNFAAKFKLFEDEQRGGFFSTESGAADLVLRVKDDYDGAEPSGNSVATDVLLRLAHLTDGRAYAESAERSLRSFAPKLKAQSAIAPQMMCAVGRYLSEPEQVVIRCERPDADAREILRQEWSRFRPYASVLALSDTETAALGKTAPFLASLERKGRITVYRCRNFACELPETVN